MFCIVPNITLSLICQTEKAMKSNLKYIVLSIALTGIFSLANAQSAKDSIYNEISHMDSVVFNAFNTRDVEKFKSLFTEDLEFYHDKGGLTNYEHTINFMKEVAKNDNGLRRDLVKGSLEVYPVPGYGAMEIEYILFVIWKWQTGLRHF
jgi:hypothetical protein